MSQEPEEIIEQKEAERTGLNIDSDQKYFIRSGQTYFRFASGKEVRIGNISPLLGAKLEEKYPAPTIPMQTLAKADGIGTYEEPNPKDARYEQEYGEYRSKIERLSRRMIIMLAVAPYLELTDSDRREVQAYRSFMRELDGTELEDSDEFCFVAYCLIKSVDDYNYLTTAVMNRTRPTEAAIIRAIESTFPANVQGSAAG